MQSSNALHNKVIKEYEKLRSNREEQLRQKREEMYSLYPEVKRIDDEISALAIKEASRIITDGITPEEAVSNVNNQRSRLTMLKSDILKDKESEYTYVPYNCNICKDTGIVDGKMCACYSDILQNILISDAKTSGGMRSDFAKDTFDTFNFAWYSKEIDPKTNICPFENIKSVYTICKEFCRDFSVDKSSNLYFYGSSGTGKTFMANCIANELIYKGYSVLYQSAYKLFQFMEDYKFCRIDRDANSKFYESIYNCDLLIIDDLGTEFGTAYTCSVLFDILNTRLVNGKSTIISTNLAFPNLESKYTERVYSRIVGNFDVIRFIGDDIRILKKQNR